MWKGKSERTGGRRMSWSHWVLEDGGNPCIHESQLREQEMVDSIGCLRQSCAQCSLSAQSSNVIPQTAQGHTCLGGIHRYLKIYSVYFGEFCFQVELRRHRERTHAHTHAHLCVHGLKHTPPIPIVLLHMYSCTHYQHLPPEYFIHHSWGLSFDTSQHHSHPEVIVYARLHSSACF